MKLPVEINNHNVPYEIKDFIDAIKANKRVSTPGEEGAKTVAVCRAIVESAAKGDKVIPDYNF